MSPRIIIIGAGAAGLAAAAKLYENRITQIKILEAESRIGGRINTIPFGDKNIDLGAQWCHGEEGNIVHQYVKNLNLLGTSKCDYKSNQFYDSNGNIINRAISDELFAIAMNITSDYDVMRNTKGSFGDYFMKCYTDCINREFKDKATINIANMFVNWFHKLILCYDASEHWFDISASGMLQYKECEGDPLLNWKDKGYVTFLDVLMQNLPQSTLEKMLQLNKEVENISWSNPNLVVRCTDGTIFEADHVIITVSLGVLKAQHVQLFTPELPLNKVDAIEKLGFGSVNKILLRFPNRWWNENDTSFCFMWTKNDILNIRNEFTSGPSKNGRFWLEDINGFYVIDSNPKILMGWMVGEMVKDVEMLNPSIIENGCMYLLRKFLGDKYEISAPEEILCSKWSSNSHFQGSYSFKNISSDINCSKSLDLSEPLLEKDNKPTILFAGEATHPHYFSTVHGAVETGFREANNIITYYKNVVETESRPKFISKY